MHKNKYGLSRTIPPSIKQIVRRNAGFGCVICGASIIQYEHVDPEFKDAKKHDPNCITLLCPSCHTKITTKFWPKDVVKNAMHSPECKKLGFTRDSFNFGLSTPTIILGGLTIPNCERPLKILNNDIIVLKSPTISGEPFLLSAWFYNKIGNELFNIIDNEWIAFANNWDIIHSGGSIIIESRPNEVALKLRVILPNTIYFEKIEMFFKGFRILGDADNLEVIHPIGAIVSFTQSSGGSHGFSFG